MKRLLLETHALLWWLAGDRQLGAAAQALIADPSSQVFVSAIVIWEIEIKRALGKLQASADLVQEVVAERFTPLQVTLEHAAAAGRLAPLHQDPFDRILVAQATCEGLSVVTRDAQIARYGVAIVPADR